MVCTVCDDDLGTECSGTVCDYCQSVDVADTYERRDIGTRMHSLLTARRIKYDTMGGTDHD